MKIVDEDWNSFDDDPEWWYHKGGKVEIRNGKLLWTFREGMEGGVSPGKVAIGGFSHGPYEYHRDEGVVLSENFHGHQSSVNKLRFWNPQGSGSVYVGFFGRDDGRLTLGFNSGTARYRWNGAGQYPETPPNYASPTAAQATVTRGVPHTIETLIYVGTPGNNDGWIKGWLDGVLVLDFRDQSLVRVDGQPYLTDLHFAPVWGGMGDVVPATQTLSIERSYVSVSALER